MKCLIVYYIGGQWFGEEVSWKRSGSGTYREISRIEIPQSKAEIEKFAAENRYKIEWRGAIPAELADGRHAPDAEPVSAVRSGPQRCAAARRSGSGCRRGP